MTATDKATLAFIVVFLSSALWPNLPSFSLLIASFCLAFCSFMLPVSAYVRGALLAFIWASCSAYWYTQWQIDEEVFNHNLIVEGRVTSIQVHQLKADAFVAKGAEQASLRFNFELSALGKKKTYQHPSVRLTWYRAPIHVKQGQTLRLLVNLKAPNTLANEHGFNYQKWLASQNIVATGYVLESPTNKILEHSASLRQNSIDLLTEQDLKHLPYLQALSFGFRGLLDDADWRLMQQSGTAHLFAISGLHVSIVFAYCLLLVKIPTAFMMRLAAKQINLRGLSVMLAALVAIFYAYMAGFQIPVSRAILSLLFWSYLLLSQSYWRLHSIVLYLLCSFFILFPFSILSISFYFSFIAVLSIWLFIWRFMPKSRMSFWQKCKYSLYLQLWLSAITLPLTVVLFGEIPLTALIANMLLLPVVSFVLVPLCVMASFALVLGLPHARLFELADIAMGATLHVMQFTAKLNETFVSHFAQYLALWQIELAPLAWFGMFILLLFTMCLLMPAIAYRKSMLVLLSLCFMFTLFSPQYIDTPKLHVLDVGQGSAALLVFSDKSPRGESINKAWIFDLGGAFPSGFSMAESVIIPYLKHYRITQIDKVFLSHLDNDHGGGLAALSAGFPINALYSPQHFCAASKYKDFAVSEDSRLSYEILWPLEAQSGHKNSHSCIVKLTVNQSTVLFAGDIESKDEQALLRYYGNHASANAKITSAKAVAAGEASLKSYEPAVKADVLIAPHHGSSSSSTQDFIDAVSPSTVIFAASAHNRWEFPHGEVSKRYSQAGARQLQTGVHGAISLVFETGSANRQAASRISISSYREDGYKRWFSKPSQKAYD